MSVHSEFTIEMCCFVHSLCNFLACAARGAIDTLRQRTRRIEDDSKLENESKDNRRWLHEPLNNGMKDDRRQLTHLSNSLCLLARERVFGVNHMMHTCVYIVLSLFSTFMHPCRS